MADRILTDVESKEILKQDEIKKMVKDVKKKGGKELSVFDVLSKVQDVKTEKKGNFTYSSWASIWQKIKEAYPDANYKIYTTESGYPAFLNKNVAQGGFVKVGVSISNLEHIEYYPILSYNNQSMLNEKVTSFDINKSIKRALVKACAMHGLGLNLYLGEEFKDE